MKLQIIILLTLVLLVEYSICDQFSLNYKLAINAATKEYVKSQEWKVFQSNLGFLFPVPTCADTLGYPASFDWSLNEIILCYEFDAIHPWPSVHEKAGKLLVNTLKNHFNLTDLPYKFLLVNTTEKGYFPSLKYAVESGACHVAVASTNYNIDRASQVDFQCPYGVSYDGFIRSNLDNSTLIISDPKDLNQEGVIVTAFKTTTSYNWAVVNLPKAKIISVGNAEAYQMILANQVHAMFGDSTELNNWLENNKVQCSKCFVKLSGESLNFGTFIAKVNGTIISSANQLEVLGKVFMFHMLFFILLVVLL